MVERSKAMDKIQYYLTSDDPYERLFFKLIRDTYDDLFSKNEQKRKSAQLFFRDNPYELSDSVLDKIEKQFEKDKKERGCVYAKFKYQAD